MKTFVQLSKAWYAEDNFKLMKETLIDEITISFSDSDAYFTLSWIKLNNEVCCKLVMFTDAWRAFEAVPELFKELTQFHQGNDGAGSQTKKEVSPDEIVKVLKKLKFKDITETQRKN